MNKGEIINNSKDTISTHKKKGRKPKISNINDQENNNIEKKIPKKRGRKPKGGKIILNTTDNKDINVPEPNIILHLKCRLNNLINNDTDHNNDTEYSSIKSINNNIQPFQFEQNKQDILNYQIIKDNKSQNDNDNIDYDSDIDNLSNIWKKLKELAINLHTNNISDKKSACFWCTCDFDNPPIYIPKYELNDTYHCYGCFCSPECATAYLFKEPIDSAIRFERYHLINHLYCKIYNYEKNVKPAPDPFYTLNKYYGNLSIQEYRKLLKNERLLLVVDKPLTRILPELHEDNDDFILNNKSIPSGTTYKLRRNRQKQTKNEILSETFKIK